MAKNNNLTDFLTDVANAIREKKGTSDPINPQNFSDEIASIETGGGGGAAVVAESDVNFRDYDGTLLHSYTKSQFLALSELPELPSQPGLVCQEWNITFDDAKNYVQDSGILEIGATYITDDGNTRLYVTIPYKGRKWLYLSITQSISNGVVIDWGDGQQETLDNISNSILHKYSVGGDYIITLSPLEGCILGLGSTNTAYSIMGAVQNDGYVFTNLLNKVEIGRNTTIKSHAFNSCYSLEYVTIPNYITELPTQTFVNCKYLRHLVIPKSVTSQSTYVFKGCTSLQRLVLNMIGSYVLSGCLSLKNVCIKQATSIDSYAFSECVALPSITFPKTITSISSYAFQKCYGIQLYDFRSLEKVPQLSSTNAFSNTYTAFKIVVPDALYEAWCAASNWSTYASRIVKASEYTE